MLAGGLPETVLFAQMMRVKHLGALARFAFGALPPLSCGSWSFRLAAIPPRYFESLPYGDLFHRLRSDDAALSERSVQLQTNSYVERDRTHTRRAGNHVN